MMRLPISYFLGIIVFGMCALPKPQAFADDDPVAISVGMEKLEGFSFASIIVKNNTDNIQRVETVRVKYNCADGASDEVSHTLRISLAPQEEYQSEGTIVCPSGSDVSSFYMLSGEQTGNAASGANVITRGNQIYYYLPCGDGSTVSLVLQWDEKKKRFIYNASNGVSGMLDQHVLEDGSFGESVCAPAPAQLIPEIVELKNYFFSKIEKDIPALQIENKSPMGIRAGTPSRQAPPK